MFVPQEGAATLSLDRPRLVRRGEAPGRSVRSFRAALCVAALLLVQIQTSGCVDHRSGAILSSVPPIASVSNIPGGATADDAKAPEPSSPRIQLGASVRGTPIVMDLFGDGPDRILIIGGLHGDEPNGALIAERLVEYLRARPELAAGRTIGIVTRANPDGLKAGTRTNAHGVDLNRNFPTRDWRVAELGELPHGGAPSSEPETRAIVAAVEQIRPSRLIDIHSISAGEQCNNFDGPARELASQMSEKNGYPISSDIGYPTPGALGCWAGIDLRIPAVTLELPRGAEVAACWRDNAEALRAAIRMEGITASTAAAARPESVEARK